MFPFLVVLSELSCGAIRNLRLYLSEVSESTSVFSLGSDKSFSRTDNTEQVYLKDTWGIRLLLGPNLSFAAFLTPCLLLQGIELEAENVAFPTLQG